MKFFSNLFGKKIPTIEGIAITTMDLYAKKPYYTAEGPKITLYFQIGEQIDDAWKQKNYSKLVRLCEEHIQLSHDFLKAEEIAANLNKQKFMVFHVKGYYRLSMYYERISKDYLACIAVSEKAIEAGQDPKPYQGRIERCRKLLNA
jgi:hypothetical protein